MSIEITLPELSPTMTKGTLSRWLIKPSDKVTEGDIIAEVETDKVTVEIESPNSGYVANLLASAGEEDIPVGQVICILSQESVAQSTAAANEMPNPEPEQTKTTDNNPPINGQPVKDKSTHQQPIINPTTINATPLALRLANQAGIDLSSISASGPRGRIVKKDLEQASQHQDVFRPSDPLPTQHNPVPTQPTVIDSNTIPPYTAVANSGMRNVISERLTCASRDIPHFYMSVDCLLDPLLALRQTLNQKETVTSKISINDFIIKTMCHALQATPQANSMWAGDGIYQFEQVDIAIAVALDNGLITPIIRDVARKGLSQIASESKALVALAQQGKLSPQQYQGGTFTLSNLGMYGVDNFTSIINPPQNGILSIGAGQRRPVVIDEQIQIATVMTVTLAMDHRCVDGVIGAKLLQAFKAVIEDPMSLLL